MIATSQSHAAVGGCWVHAFGNTQFRPPLTTYTGPSHEPLFMRGAASVIVGPQARLVGYARERYEVPTLELPPGARVPDLEVIDFHRRVDSFRVVCTDG